MIVILLLSSRENINKSHPLLGKRTLDFWARQGILKRPFRIPGRKDAFYRKDYIYNAVAGIILAKSKFGQNLKNLAEISKVIKHDWEPILIDLLGLLDEYNQLRIQRSPGKNNGEEKRLDFDESMIGRKYLGDIRARRKNKLKDIQSSYQQLEIAYEAVDSEEKRDELINSWINS